MKATQAEEKLMQRAMELARRGWGRTHPNPLVGALIEEDGEVVAEGWHARAGQDHAEVVALKALGRAPRPGARLVVTLEPCCTKGRTGACTDAILKAGLNEVVVGAIDPNPAHAGRGLEHLRRAGVKVTEGVLAEACRDLNLIFNHHIVTKRPLIAGKVATTLDGKVATRSGHARWVTGEEAREDVMHWRDYFPAIAVGSGTVLADNPALTVRLPGQIERSVRRFVFDRTLRSLSRPESRLFNDQFRHTTTVVTHLQADERFLAQVQEKGLEVWALAGSSSQAFLEAFVTRCNEEGVTGVYLEGGPRLLSAFLEAKLLDYLFAYRAPVFLADDEAPTCFGGQTTLTMQDALALDDVRHRILGRDQMFRGFISRQNPV